MSQTTPGEETATLGTTCDKVPAETHKRVRAATLSCPVLNIAVKRSHVPSYEGPTDMG